MHFKNYPHMHGQGCKSGSLSLISPLSSHEGMKSCLAFSIQHLHLTLDPTVSFYDRQCLLQAA